MSYEHLLPPDKCLNKPVPPIAILEPIPYKEAITATINLCIVMDAIFDDVLYGIARAWREARC